MSAHGTLTRFVQGCSCTLCTVAARRAVRNRRDRRPATVDYKTGKPRQTAPVVPDLALDVVTAKVGHDFPALGTTLRYGWAAGA